MFIAAFFYKILQQFSTSSISPICLPKTLFSTCLFMVPNCMKQFGKYSGKCSTNENTKLEKVAPTSLRFARNFVLREFSRFFCSEWKHNPSSNEKFSKLFLYFFNQKYVFLFSKFWIRHHIGCPISHKALLTPFQTENYPKTSLFSNVQEWKRSYHLYVTR